MNWVVRIPSFLLLVSTLMFHPAAIVPLPDGMACAAEADGAAVRGTEAVRKIADFYRTRDRAAAAAELSLLLGNDDTLPAVLFEAGRLAYDNGHAYYAARALLSATAEAEGLPPAARNEAAAMLDGLYAQGEALAHMQREADVDTEVQFLSRRLERAPDDAVALARRGLARQRQYHIDQALDDLIAAQKLGLDDLQLRSMVQRARVDLERFVYVATQGGHDVGEEFLFYDVRDHMQTYERRADWRGQERYLADVMAREPLRGYAAIQRAYMRISRGDLDGAEADFATALSVDLHDDSREDIERGRRLIAELRQARLGLATDQPPSGLWAIASKPAFMGRMPSTPWYRASSKLRLAEQLARSHAFQALTIVLGQLDSMTLNETEQARYQACVGEVKWAEGRFDEAAALFRHALNYPLRDTRRAALLYRLARYHADRGEREAGMKYARESLALTAQFGWAQVRVGQYLIDAGEHEEGFAHLEEALRLAADPEEQAGVYVTIMDAARDLGQTERFVETAGRYVAMTQRLTPPLPAALDGMAEYYQGEIHRARGEEDEAYTYYERASRRVASAELRARILMDLAEVDVQRGDLDQARQKAEQAAAMFPDRSSRSREALAFIRRLDLLGGDGVVGEPAPQVNRHRRLREFAALADAAQRAGDDEEYLHNARRYVEAAADGGTQLLPREQGLAHLYRAEIASHDGNVAEAYSAYLRAEALLGDAVKRAAALMAMARMDAATGRVGEAVTRARLAAELEAGYSHEYLDLAASYLAADNGDAGRVAFYTGEVLAASGNDDGAAEQYQSAATLLDDVTLAATVFLKLADYNLRRGEDDLAAGQAERAAELAADQPERLLEAARLLLRLDLPDRAFPVFRRWLAATPVADRQPAPLFDLADAFQRRGETDQAFEAVRLVMHTEDVEASGENPEGLLAYYRARMHDTHGEGDLAYAAYDQASRLLRSPVRLAGIYLRMAEHQNRVGARAGAEAFARKAAALQPDSARLMRDVGYFFLALDEPDIAREYIDHFLTLAATPEENASILAALADAYAKQGDVKNYALAVERYADVVFGAGRTPSASEEARLALFQADIHTRRGEPDQVFLAYQRASRFVGNKYQLADIYYRMAIYLTDAGNVAQAVENMELSVASMPTAPWKLRQAAGFYGNLGMTEQMITYHRRALENSTNPESQAVSIAALAHAYRTAGYTDSFLEYADRYVVLQRGREGDLDPEERGTLAYFQGELYAVAGDDAAAHAEFARAARLVAGPALRADLLYRLALYHAGRGELDQAALFMEQSVAALPGTVWKLRQAAGFFGGLGMTEIMLDYLHHALNEARTPAGVAVSLAALANAYRDLDDQETYLDYARRYVELQTERDAMLDSDERGLRHYYQAEIHAAAGAMDAAYGDYVLAAELVTAPATLSAIYTSLAQYHADRGDTESAAASMARSVEVLPDAVWKHRQAAGFYAELGLTDQAAASYRQVLAMDAKPSDRLAARLALAELYREAKTMDEYIRALDDYLAALEAEAEPSLEQLGQRHYYRGELYLAQGRAAPAVREYEEALRYPLGDSRRVELHLRLARHFADAGNVALASRHIEGALATVSPQTRTMRRIADLYQTLEMYDHATHYFRQALAAAGTFRERASIVSAMANAARARRDEAEYLTTAQEYCRLVQAHAAEAGNAEQGLCAFYQGEVHAARRQRDAAYSAYLRATTLLDNGSRRSESYLKLARYDLARRDRLRAGEHALLAAAADPGRGYRVSEAARILNSLRRYHDAERILRTAIAMDPHGDSLSLGNDYLHKYLAETYVEGIDKGSGLAINAAYIDRLAVRLNAGDRDNPDQRTLDEWWDARRRQTRWRKNWGSFESRLYGSRDRDGDYTIGSYAELVKIVRFPNGFRLKLTGEIGGTLKGHYTGTTRSRSTGRKVAWESDSYLADTMYGVVGLRRTLFPNIAKLTPLDARMEYRFGLGRNDDEDYRFRLKWDRSLGLTPRLEGNFWAYKKEELDLTYSVTNGDWTTDGTIRRGTAYSPWWDRNLVIAPYAFVDYDYAGKDATHKWGLAAGPGLILRQYHWEDRHHFPRAYLEFNLRYRFGLSNGKQDALHFSIVWKY